MAGKTSGRYVNSLDGLRALCALAVVGYHMRLSWCSGGLLGVTVLFVLSGYLVTAGLMREFSSTRGNIDVRGFWKRRFWRLMPTVFVFVALTGTVCAVANHALFTKMRGDIIPALLMVINWSKIFSNESYFAAAGAPSPLTHFWSLAIEAQFYLVWPVVFYALMRKGVRRRTVGIGLVVASALSAALMAALYVPGADPSRPYYGTDTRAMSLLLGCWLAVAWPFDRMSARRASTLTGPAGVVVKVAGPLCVVGLVAMMVLTEGYSAFSYYGGILLCSLVAAGAIAALVPAGSPLARVMSARPLAWVGTRSYAIYLWHYPILELMNPLTATEGIPWWKLVAELALILAVAELSYRFVERPLRKGLRGLVVWEPARDASAADGLAGKGGTHRRLSPRALMPAMPALLVGGLSCIGLVVGLLVVEPVTVAGDNVADKRVMHASLRKPAQDGIYDVVLVGDSVSLGANEQLNATFPHGMIDTRGEREAPEALEVLQGYLDAGVVGDDVVISIGTNGILTSEELEAFLDAVGERSLWFVNLRSPNAKDEDNNALLDSFAEAHDNVHLIDWHGATEGHDDWLIEDGIHLTWDGRDAYAQLVASTMGYEAPTEKNTTYDVVILGDVACLDAADELAAAFPRGLVDTAEGRSTADVVRAYESYAEQGVVGPDVVVCLGSEDPLEASEAKAVLDAVGEGRRLWFVTVRVPGSWTLNNNRLLEHVVRQYDNVRLIDWYAESSGRDGWFDEDGVHLTDEGADAYAQLILREISAVRPQEAEETDEYEGDDESDYESYASADYADADYAVETSDAYDYDYSYDYGYEDDSGAYGESYDDYADGVDYGTYDG